MRSRTFIESSYVENKYYWKVATMQIRYHKRAVIDHISDFASLILDESLENKKSMIIPFL